MQNTYWNNNGTHADLVEKLEKLIPYEGSIPNPRKNRNLELFRKAVNVYYDLYNNGLYNRKSEFRSVFDLNSSYYKVGPRVGFSYAPSMYTLVEQKMDAIILAAAKEQKLL